MIIGIDGNEANVQNRVGIGEYGFELLKQFKEFQIPKVKFQIYLKSLPLSDMPVEDENWSYRVIGPGKLWTQIGLPFDLFTHKPRPDVFFTPTHYAPRFCPVPSVISVMDLSYLHFPELFKQSDLYQLRNWTSYSVRSARRIFTISQASKNDIMTRYNIPDKNIIVTYPGIKPGLRISASTVRRDEKNHDLRMEELQKKFGIRGKYILFVGTLQPRKNISRLVEAFALLENSDVQLIVVGKKGWLYEDILSAPEKYNVKQRVLFLDFVSNESLPTLYKHAEFFILPSLYEGFGLPVLEAMKYECPVIISNVSSLPEVGGDAALYVNPLDVSDITEKMQKLLGDKELQKKLVEKGKEQIKKFSWEKTAMKTLEVLQEVAA